MPTLVNRDFTWLLTGTVTSRLGTGIFDTTLLLWIATDLLAGERYAPAVSAGVPMIACVVGLLVGPLAGVLVDRWDKKRTMITSDLVQAALLAVSAVFIALGERGFSAAATLGVIGLLVALVTVTAQFFSPARSVLIGDIVDARHRGRASGYGQVSDAMSGLLGPALAGPMLVFFGPVPAILVNAASYLVSAWCIGRVTVAPVAVTAVAVGPRSATTARAGLWAEFRAGAATFHRFPLIRVLVITIVIALLGAASVLTLDIYFLTEVLHVDRVYYGVLSASIGVGILVGALVGGHLADRVDQGRLFGVTALLLGVLFTAYALQTHIVPATVCLGLAGVVLGANNTCTAPIVLAVVPREVQGRVWAFFGLANKLAVLVSLALGSVLGSLMPQSMRWSLLGREFERMDTLFLGCGLLIVASGIYALRGTARYPLAAAVAGGHPDRHDDPHYPSRAG